MGVCLCEHLQWGYVLTEYGKFSRLLDCTAGLSFKLPYPLLGIWCIFGNSQGPWVGLEERGFMEMEYTHFSAWLSGAIASGCSSALSWVTGEVESCLLAWFRMCETETITPGSLFLQRQILSPALPQEGRCSSVHIAWVLAGEMDCRHPFPRATQDSSKGGQRTAAGALCHQRPLGPESSGREAWTDGLTGLGRRDVRWSSTVGFILFTRDCGSP